MSRRYDDGEDPHQYAEPKDKYRHTYFETLELAVGEIERFEQSDLCIVKELENLLLNATNSRDIEPLSDVVLKYLGDHNQLKIQLLMLPDMIETTFAGEVPVKKVTNVRTIVNAMEQSDICDHL